MNNEDTKQIVDLLESGFSTQESPANVDETYCEECGSKKLTATENMLIHHCKKELLTEAIERMKTETETETELAERSKGAKHMDTKLTQDEFFCRQEKAVEDAAKENGLNIKDWFDHSTAMAYAEKSHPELFDQKNIPVPKKQTPTKPKQTRYELQEAKIETVAKANEIDLSTTDGMNQAAAIALAEDPELFRPVSWSEFLGE